MCSCFLKRKKTCGNCLNLLTNDEHSLCMILEEKILKVANKPVNWDSGEDLNVILQKNMDKRGREYAECVKGCSDFIPNTEVTEEYLQHARNIAFMTIIAKRLSIK